jgi:diguanylate cyclase (GGDEF)-like protein/PAS domain S-box-containing protein
MVNRAVRVSTLRLRRHFSRPDVVARWLAVLVLLVGLVLTAFAAFLTAAHERQESETVFAHRAEQSVSVIESRFALYAALVRAGEALFAGSTAVEREDWRDFARTLGVPEAYPGAASLLFIRHLPAETLDRELATIRADGAPDFRIDRFGDRSRYCPIVYNEPFDYPPLGFDACMRPIPNETLFVAAKRRGLAVSRPVHVTDPSTGPERAGVVIYGSVFRDGALFGWIALPVDVAAVIGEVAADAAGFSIRLYDGVLDETALIYPFGQPPPNGVELLTLPVQLAGRNWVLAYTQPPVHYDTAPAVVAAGAIISVLLFLLLWRAGTMRARALALAEHMTVALRKSEAQRQRAEAFSLVMVTKIDLEGHWRQVPPTLCRLLGKSSSELIGQHCRETIAPEDFPAHWEQCERLLRGEIRSFDLEQRFLHRDGHTLWLYVNWSIVTDDDGQPLHFLAYLRDVSEAKRTQLALERSEEKYRNIIQSLEDPYFETDLAGNLTFVNQALVRTLGYSPSELIGMNNREFTHAADAPEVFKAFNQVYQSGEPARGLDWRILCKDGTVRFIETSIALVRDGEGAPTGFRGIARDVTERRQADERIHHLAHYDALTGLPNRTLFEDRLKQVLKRRKRAHERAALLFIDLDRFKTVNDSLGHHTGDLLLRAVAQRISECVRAGDTVGRPGGDEFLVLLADLDEPEDAARVAEKILTAVSEPYTLEGWEFSMTPSIGIAVIPDDGTDIESLVRNADVAMYHAKENGRNNFQFFTGEMNEDAAERLSLEHGLRRALERGELELYYQPIVNVDEGRVIGAEALVRWNRPGHGVVPAGAFIGIVEQSGLILTIGDWVLNEACRQARAWQVQFGIPFPIAVNLSALQFRQHGLTATVARVIEETGVDPACLVLELTESVVMQDARQTIDTVFEMQKLGVHFAIDDFGTGYSSLSYLKRFPIDRLKIDRSFVRDLGSDPDDTALIHAIISMARSLRMEVIAEGVETKAQRDYLQAHDCAVMQGYLFSKPVPAAEFERFLIRPLL